MFFVYWCLVFYFIEVSILVPRAILSYSLYSRKPSLRVREHVWRGRLYISKTCASYIDWSESQNPNQVQVWLDPLSACNPTPQHVCSHTHGTDRGSAGHNTLELSRFSHSRVSGLCVTSVMQVTLYKQIKTCMHRRTANCQSSSH